MAIAVDTSSAAAAAIRVVAVAAAAFAALIVEPRLVRSEATAATIGEDAITYDM
ncbi:hypothetical protein NIIDMKKI_35150 [Mycobacterium kansasii]|uniref:Uncharacterized protein n=1 Tax=Mycobacterium kansasii TaxID=1768 RepID=A0A1V3XDG5_MYCKA|nr:hypothetical protein BZL29_3771 [Mycobacterium kansasii]BCI88309.1 hypothetical protein NIIDMKKI_35150 [Mycobacterium kansasii]VAZ60741.1 hypothetical protein LAUMK22_02550 [Mycobacterium kansasii]VAZ67063.1 hypothetical protein LAUMK40_03202 [Mycobacterium kansasii]VTP03313.1 hypothetical protein BIN_B_03889 [Mycobacterium kansasii]